MQMGKETSLQSARSAAKRTKTDQNHETQLTKNLPDLCGYNPSPPPPTFHTFLPGPYPSHRYGSLVPFSHSEPWVFLHLYYCSLLTGLQETKDPSSHNNDVLQGGTILNFSLQNQFFWNQTLDNEAAS